MKKNIILVIVSFFVGVVTTALSLLKLMTALNESANSIAHLKAAIMDGITYLLYGKNVGNPTYYNGRYYYEPKKRWEYTHGPVYGKYEDKKDV